jgi:PAS domain S-box-containing protein
MAKQADIAAPVSALNLSWPARYGGALLAVAAALTLWVILPWMHKDPFAIHVLAVVFCARFLGFGSAVFCTALSVLIIDYVSLQPHFSLALSAPDIARLTIFVGISLLAASLARQKSRAQVLVDQTHQKMASIVESSDDAIYSTQLDGTITSWNRGAEELYGYSADDVLGKPVSMLMPADRAHEMRSSSEYLARGERVASHLTERVRKDGSRVTIQLSLSPLRDRRGLVVGVSAIARDVTVQQWAEEALRRNEKLASAGRLTAAIAHEINNPLEAVTNLLYLARHDPGRADQHLQMAEREILRIADIAQLTLGLVRDTSGAVPLHIVPLLEEVVQLYSTRLSAKGIVVKTEFSPRDEIRGFPSELRQLFSNLIVNAIEAMPQGGRLCLHVANIPERIPSRRPGVRISIADTGAGIHREHRNRIFEPFFTTRGDSGTGLGLWLSESVVQKHKGWIRFRSCTGPQRSGTVFMIFLPEGAPAPSSQRPPAQPGLPESPSSLA